MGPCWSRTRDKPHCLTCHLTHSKYVLIDQLCNYICASQVNNHSNSLPTMKCETSFPLFSLRKSLLKIIIKVGEVGVRVGPCLNAEVIKFKNQAANSDLFSHFTLIV